MNITCDMEKWVVNSKQDTQLSGQIKGVMRPSAEKPVLIQQQI